MVGVSMATLLMHVPTLPVPVEITGFDDDVARKIFNHLNEHGVRTDLVTTSEHVEMWSAT